MYTFVSPSLSLTYKTPEKYTPVTVNGGDSITRTFGSGGESGALNGFPFNLLQVTHLLNSFLTHCQIDGMQYTLLSAVNVMLTLP